MAFISRIVDRADKWTCTHEIQYTSNGPLYRYTESRSMGYPQEILCSIRKDENSEVFRGSEDDVRNLVYVWTVQGFKWPRYDVVLWPLDGTDKPPRTLDSFYAKHRAEEEFNKLVPQYGRVRLTIKRVDWEEYSKENNN